SEKGHLPEFEDNKNYEIIGQLSCIYSEYLLSEWDFYQVTISNKSDTSKKELFAFNEYIN
ncbi:18597_t:CDS:1, partial [Gigaspora margarita]